MLLLALMGGCHAFFSLLSLLDSERICSLVAKLPGMLALTAHDTQRIFIFFGVWGLGLNVIKLFVLLWEFVFPQRPPLAYRRLLLGVCLVFMLSGFGSLAGVSYIILENDALRGYDLTLFGALHFHLDPDWGRLSELFAYVREAMGQLVPGAEQAPIVLTLEELKSAGAGQVGAS